MTKSVEKEKEKRIPFKSFLRKRITNIPNLVVHLIFVIFMIASAILFMTRGQWRDVGLSLGLSLVSPLVFIIEYLCKFRIPPVLLTLIFFLVAGAILGSCYNFYATFPLFDDVLHTFAGLLMMPLGFGIMKRLLGNAEGKKNFGICLFVGIFFSLGIGLLWEMIELLGTTLFNVDMQEDIFVNQIKSFTLAGDHQVPVIIDDISKTVIYYGDGQTFVLEGYLDLGVKDTLKDMLVCLVGTVISGVIFMINYACKGKVHKYVSPVLWEEDIHISPLPFPDHKKEEKEEKETC
ncbi:MAG: hypothetical protein IKC60_03060 [Clostridia bacterium]|nr:hypothetical protein [Clostridia bacterium]